MKIYQVVAKKSGHFCGVVDYTQCLVKKSDSEITNINGYGLADVYKIMKLIKNDPSNVLHVQYPSLGMGRSPLIAILPLLYFKAKTVITLHEFSVFSLTRKLYMLLWSVFANAFIFTNQYEADKFCKYYPWVIRKVYIIPIGTNISNSKHLDIKREGVCYFGQISEGKGIDDFIDMVILLRKKKSNIKCSVIGAVVDKNLPIVKRLMKDAKTHGINLILNKDSDAVSKALSSHEYAVLPFPDGVTDKRGSALACLANGLQLITVQSALTPSWWREVSHNFVSVEHCIYIILHNKMKCNRDILKINLKERQWPNIAMQHLKIYERL